MLRLAEPLALLMSSVVFGVGSWSVYSLLRWVGLADRLMLEWGEKLRTTLAVVPMASKLSVSDVSP